MSKYSGLTIGVLALQGDFERHIHGLELIGAGSREIRQNKDLENLDGLIIPGGESTTISQLLDRFDIRTDLEKLCQAIPVWGTCAGMIMLASEVNDPRVQPLNLIDIRVKRNGYGRQVHSFFADIEASLDGKAVSFKASFIRAPKIERYGEKVKILAYHDDEPVLCSQDNYMASSFHTELSDDITLLEYFLQNFVPCK